MKADRLSPAPPPASYVALDLEREVGSPKGKRLSETILVY